MLHLACAHLAAATTAAPVPLNAGETDWVRRTGVVVGHIGAILAARNGLMWLFRGARERLRAWRRGLAGHREAPGGDSPGPPGPRHGPAGHGTPAPAAPQARMLVGEFAWRPEAPPGEKVEILRTEVTSIRGRINDLDQTFHARHSELRTLVEAKVGEFGDVHQAFRTLIEERDSHESAVDGRGLLLVAVGILLSGLPGELAHYPPVGWTAITVALLLTITVGVAVARERG